MNQQPLISIVIPVYKGANYLAEAIDSALNQTYKNIEILVVNDGSPDDGETERVALSYGDKIRYIYKENGGVSSALNLGIKEMKGEYFSWLSHDDLYEPTKIQKQVELIQNENEIILCSGKLMDERGRPIPHKVKTLAGTFSGTQLFKEKLHNYILNGLGFLVPKSVFDNVGGFDESMKYLQDFDMWLRVMLSNDFSFRCHKDLLVVSRIHKNQQTNTISHVFDNDRIALAIKHAKIIRHMESTSISKSIWCELYYRLYVRENNIPGKKVFYKMLREFGYSKFKIFIIAFPYYITGRIKLTLRYIYDIYLKYKRKS